MESREIAKRRRELRITWPDMTSNGEINDQISLVKAKKADEVILFLNKHQSLVFRRYFFLLCDKKK
jgi:hypothetical protein